MRLALQLTAHKLPFQREFRFHPERKWRFDFLVADDLAVEVEGGIWLAGRHSRGGGFEKDAEKYNTAVILGYRVLRVSTGQVKKGIALGWILKALQAGKRPIPGPGDVPHFNFGNTRC